MSDDDLRKYLPSAETLASALDEQAAQAAAQKTGENPAVKLTLAELLATRKPGEQPFDWLDDPQWLPDAEPSERVEHVPPTELPRARVPHVTLTKIRVAPEVIAATPGGARAATPAGRAAGAAGEGNAPMLDPRRTPTQPRLGTPGAALAPVEQVILPSTWTTTTKDPGVGAASASAPLHIKEEGRPWRTEGQAALAIEKAALPSAHAPAPAPASARPAMSRGRMGVIGLAISLALVGLVVLAKPADTVSLPEPAAVVTAAAPVPGDPPVPPVKSTTAATVSPRPPQPAMDGGAVDSPAAPIAPPTTSHPEPSAPPAVSTAPTTPPKPPRPSSAGATTGHSQPIPSPTATSSTPPSAPAPTATSPWGEREF